MSATWPVVFKNRTSNFGRGGGNKFPNVSGLQNQPDMPRGKSRFGKRDFLEYALSRGAIRSLSTTPVLDFMRATALNEDLPLPIRIGAGAPLLPFEARRKASTPYVPPLPDGYILPRLVDTKACLEAAAKINADILSGVLRLDTGERLLAQVETIRAALKPTEVEQEIIALREFIEATEAAKTIEHAPPADTE